MTKNKNSKPDLNQTFNFYPQSELDFHEFGVITHFEIEKILNEFIEDCYVQKLKNLLIITGKGSVVRPLVNKLLKRNKLVESFKQAGYFNGQSGAIEVVLIN